MRWKRLNSSTYASKPKNNKNTHRSNLSEGSDQCNVSESNRRTGRSNASDEETARDLFDLIDEHEEAAMVEVDPGDCGEEPAADQELTEPSDLLCLSDHSFDSTMSGPSIHMMQGLCFGCQKLYQTAKKMKRPLKNKLLDHGEHCFVQFLCWNAGKSGRLLAHRSRRIPHRLSL